ncbi:MAG: formate dehydrogenase accessory sulfurtransferase FdhD [Anaerolineales bacterium]|nr:formate dehydrogenase accessory sulfurtransferase FdhD [Anaerolineales bacterium]
MMNQPVEYVQVSSGQWQKTTAAVVEERPVSLTVNGEIWLTFMCTPTYLEALAVGFLYNEGLIQSYQEIVSARVCASGENVDIWISHSLDRPAQWRRTSGCTGGVTSIKDLSEEKTIQPNGFVLTVAQIHHLVGQLFEAQELYRKSGGIHTSALSDGQLVWAAAEDIGRHNTLDKLVGRCLIENLDLPRRVLLTTGRLSSEMLQKAHRMGVKVVISRTSPSSLSIQMAESQGITIIGYARRDSFRIYTHSERVAAGAHDFEPRPERGFNPLKTR